MDHLTTEKKSWNMSRIKSADTKPEFKVRSFLHKNGYRFRLHDKNLPGSPDIVLKKYKTAIFVNGCYWHRHNNCKLTTTPKTNKKFWKNKFSDNKKRDKLNYSKLKDSGMNIIILWECDVKNNLYKKKLNSI